MANCEMCGANGQLQAVIVEGVQMVACPNCVKFGKLVSSTPQGQARNYVPGMRMPKKDDTPVDFVVANAGELIKAARESRGMRQVDLARMLNIRESLVHQIEGGNTHQVLDVVKKFETALHLKLVGRRVGVEEDDAPVVSKVDAKPLTIGDLISKAMKK
jgi:uncharacterized protein (TIGR00270 family)